MKRLFAGLILVFFLAAGTARAETLKILTWKGYAPQELVDLFEKETGIQVEVAYSNNEEIISILCESHGRGFDLVQPSQDRISSVQEKYGIYQAIDYSRIDKELFIPFMLKVVKQNTQVDGKSYGIPFCWGTSGLIVNDAFAPDVESFLALVDSRYVGKISYRLKRPLLIAIGFALGYDPFQLYAEEDGYKEMLARVEEQLIHTHANVEEFWTEGEVLLHAMETGDVVVAMAWDAGGWKLHAQNSSIDFKAPVEGALGWIDTFAIPAGAENVDAAYKWVNFIMRPENAGFFSSREKYATASAGALKYTEKSVADNFARAFPRDEIDNIKWYPPVPDGLEKIEREVLARIQAVH
jgi:spermidine/putrescine transport system substrate-binding protein